MRLRRAALLAALILGLLNRAVTAAPNVTGERPPAQAPFAADDPIPRLTLQPHGRQETPHQVAESFLYYLSTGSDELILGEAGGSVGSTDAYERAWALMGPNRPSLATFKEAWGGTAAMKVLQLEPMQSPERFFVELQQVAWCGERWTDSFYRGTLVAEPTPEGWRVRSFTVRPEHLVFSNIGGHQGWQHDGAFMAVWYARMTPPRSNEPWKEPWELISLDYQRRTATAILRHGRTNQIRTIRMARIMEGGWLLLSIDPRPDELPPDPVP